jgi:hypothetical protein
MKKALLLSFVIFGLSGCYSPIKYEYEVWVDERWWKKDVSKYEMQKIFSDECSFGFSRFTNIWDPKYKDFRIKSDTCMLQKGFFYMACEEQYQETMPVDLCENKLSSEYDYPGCKSYREKKLHTEPIRFSFSRLLKNIFRSEPLDKDYADAIACLTSEG